MTQKTTINLSDFGWLLNRAGRRTDPDDIQRYSRLDIQYYQAARMLGGQPMDDDRSVGAMRRRAQSTAEAPVHYAVVVDNLSAPPVTVTKDKAVALEAARIFNYAQQVHPGGVAYTAEVYEYTEAGRGKVVTG